MIRDQSESTAAGIGEPIDFIPGPFDGRSPERYGCSAVLGCPLCRRLVPWPGLCPDGSTPMAECVPCDLLFDIADRDIRVFPE